MLGSIAGRPFLPVESFHTLAYSALCITNHIPYANIESRAFCLNAYSERRIENRNRRRTSLGIPYLSSSDPFLIGIRRGYALQGATISPIYLPPSFSEAIQYVREQQSRPWDNRGNPPSFPKNPRNKAQKTNQGVNWVFESPFSLRVNKLSSSPPVVIRYDLGPQLVRTEYSIATKVEEN